MTASPRSTLRTLALLLSAALAMTACASKASMDARYDASLQRWKGSTRAELVAAWGKPLSDSTAAGVATLTYEVRDDIVNPGRLPTYSASNPTVLGGGTTAAPMVSVATVAPVIPMRCTTRFELRNGVVTAWTFDGLLCGAPT